MHEWVAMSAAFEDTRFDAAGTVRYLVGGNVGQEHGVHRPAVAARSRREEHPGRQDALTRQSETEMTRLFAVRELKVPGTVLAD